MDGQLPQHILEFFERTARTIDYGYRPVWLLSAPSDPIWRVDANEGDLREVKGEMRGGISLNWALRFPRARFTEKAYAVALRQVQLIFIAGIEACPNISGFSTLSAIQWHRFLMWLSEHLAVKYGRAFRRLGIRAAGLDDVAEFLDALAAAGVAGTGLFVERWQQFLSDECGDVDPGSDVTRSFLSAEEAYNNRGELRSDYVADAIEIDPFRVRLSSHMRAHLRRYGRNRSDEDCSQIPSEGTAKNAARCFVILSGILRNSVDGFSDCELADVQSVAEQCRAFSDARASRTKTLPPSVGNQLVLGCCRWMIDTAHELEEFTAKACVIALEVSKSLPRQQPMRWLWEAENSMGLPAALIPVRHLGANALRSLSQDAKCVIKYPICLLAIRLHVVICFATIALLSCSRRGEVLDLKKESIFSRRDRFYLSVLLRKRGINGFRMSMDKPVPQLVAKCMESLSRIETSLASVFGREDPLTAKRAFFKANVRGLSPLTRDDMIPDFSLLSSFFRLVDGNGKEWKLRPHQLRRYFAMTFFHSGGAEDVLPALAWFMGHEEISATWRYVREELTGREISEAEAAMATSAIFSPDESDGVARLRSIVLKHFGCDEISVMNESDAQDYLEMLAERGAFTAQPIQLGAGRRRVYTVLISISEERLSAAID